MCGAVSTAAAALTLNIIIRAVRKLQFLNQLYCCESCSIPMNAVTDFSGDIMSVSISVSPILLHWSSEKNVFCMVRGTSPYPGLYRG